MGVVVVVAAVARGTVSTQPMGGSPCGFSSAQEDGGCPAGEAGQWPQAGESHTWKVLT